MSVSGVSGGSDAAPASKEAQQVERTIAAMVQQRQAAKVQAEGMLQLIQQASPSPEGVGSTISVYA